MEAIEERVEPERENYDFFLSIPEMDRREVRLDSVKGSQILEPLFEYYGAGSGCRGTPSVKLLPTRGSMAYRSVPRHGLRIRGCG